MNQLSTEKGTYLLFIKNQKSQKITIGSLGVINFPSSYFIYVGSALGPGGLKRRLSRHLRSRKKIFWHIDYLLKKTEIVAVATIALKERLECSISQQISSRLKRPEQFPIQNFGSSDCDCTSHLFCLGDYSLPKIKQNLLLPLFRQLGFKSSWIDIGERKKMKRQESSFE